MSITGCIIRFRLGYRDLGVAEAEADNVPFTPVWWWWNKDADEYVMTLWDTEAGGGDRAHVAEGLNIITPMRAIK